MYTDIYSEIDLKSTDSKDIDFRCIDMSMINNYIELINNIDIFDTVESYNTYRICLYFDYNKLKDYTVDDELFKYLDSQLTVIELDGNHGYRMYLSYSEDIIYSVRQFKNGKLLNINEDTFNKYIKYIKILLIKRNLEFYDNNELWNTEHQLFINIHSNINYSNFNNDEYIPNICQYEHKLRIYYTFDSRIDTDVVLDVYDDTIAKIFMKMWTVIFKNIQRRENTYCMTIYVMNDKQVDLLYKIVELSLKEYKLNKLKIQTLPYTFNEIIDFTKGINNYDFIKRLSKSTSCNELHGITTNTHAVMMYLVQHYLFSVRTRSYTQKIIISNGDIYVLYDCDDLHEESIRNYVIKYIYDLQQYSNLNEYEYVKLNINNMENKIYITNNVKLYVITRSINEYKTNDNIHVVSLYNVLLQKYSHSLN